MKKVTENAKTRSNFHDSFNCLRRHRSWKKQQASESKEQWLKPNIYFGNIKYKTVDHAPTH